MNSNLYPKYKAKSGRFVLPLAAEHHEPLTTRGLVVLVNGRDKSNTVSTSDRKKGDYSARFLENART